jgi:hypothetical protein
VLTNQALENSHVNAVSPGVLETDMPAGVLDRVELIKIKE